MSLPNQEQQRSKAPTTRILLVAGGSAGDTLSLLNSLLATSSDGSFMISHRGAVDTAATDLASGQWDAVLFEADGEARNELESALGVFQAAAPQLPVIVLSRVGTGLESTALQCGAQDVLEKDKLTRAVLVRSIRFAIERKLAEKARQAPFKERLSMQSDLLNQVQTAIIATDRAGIVTDWNRHAERLYGWRAGEALGRRVTELTVLPDDAELGQSIMAQVSATGRWEGEFTVTNKNGSTFPAYVVLTLLRDAEGRPSGMVGASIDISQQRSAEQERANLMEQVKVQKVRLDNIVDSVPGIVWEAWGRPGESSQTTDFVSSYAEKMLGYTVEEWLSEPNFWARVIHPEDQGGVVSVSDRQYASLQGGANRFRCIAKDGRIVWAEAYATIVQDEQGNPIGLRGVTMDITARVQLEEQVRRQSEALKAEYERLATVVANADIAFVLLDAEGRVVLVNDFWVRRNNIPREAVLGRRYGDMGDHPVLLSAQEAVDMALSTGDPVVVRELSFYDPALGGLSYTDASLIPLHDTGGEISGAILVTIDVTDKVLARQEVESQRGLLETVLSDAPVGVIVYDRDMHITHMNAEYGRLSHLDPAASVGKLLYDLMPLSPERAAMHQQVLSGENVDEQNLTYKHPEDARPRHVDARHRPVRGADGAVIGMLSTFVDVTERAANQERIEEQKSILETILETTPIGIFFADRELRVVNMNSCYTEIAHLDRASTLGKSLYDLIPHARDRQPVFDRVLSGESVDLKSVSNLDRTDKRLHYYDIYYRPVSGGDGSIVGLIGAVVDVTERLELERQKDEFLSLASHELRTPLTAIRGFAELSLRGARNAGDEKLVRSLNVIKDKSSLLSRIVSDLVDVSRIESDVLPVQKELFDIAELIRYAVQSVELTSPGVTCSLYLPPEPVTVEADRQLIEEVLTNLLENAVKYSPAECRIEIITTAKDGEVITAVRDFGSGVPAEQQGKIFDRFYRATNAGTRPQNGLGLGLFIVKGIIERHEGRIWLESEEGEGSTFYFSLPLLASTGSVAGRPEAGG